MPALTSLSSKINNTIHPRCNLSFSNYCLDKRVHLIVTVAAFGGAFVWEISPATNLLTAFGFGILGTLWFALCGSDLSVEQRKRNFP